MIMNEETLKDLKQFITMTVRQEISGVNSRIDTVDSKITSLDSRINTVDSKITNLETRIDTVDKKVSSIREEISGVNSRIDAVDSKITSLETRINARFDDNDVMQNEILNAIGEVQESQSKAIRRQADVIDNHELRIVKLEKRTA